MNEITDTPAAAAPKYNSNPFSRTFKGLDMLFKYNSTLSIVLLIVSLFGGALQIASDLATDNDNSATQVTQVNNDPNNWVFIGIVILIVALIAIMIAAVVSVYFNGLTNFVAWKTSRHETTSFSEAFKKVTERFWTIFVVQIIVGLKIVGGLLLFIVPGIRAALRYQMVLFPVFDENLNSKGAIRRIKTLTKGHLIEVFGIATVASIIPFIGLLLSMGGEAVLYTDLKTLEASGAAAPKPHWLNYIGFILLGGLLILAALIIAVITLAT